VNRSRFEALFGIFLIAVSFAGCKKNVAAAPPAPVVQPASPPPPAPTIALRAMPTSIDRGQSVALQWEARNATNVRIEPELGAVATQGSRLVNPSSSVTYTATATGPGGSAADSQRITVLVAPTPAPPRAETRPAPDVSVESLFKQNVQTIYFDYDDGDIRPDQVSRLMTNAAWLKQRRDVKFTIEGHCDERGSEEYNLGLGDRRANRVKEFLIEQGVEASRIRTVSYGEERPACRDATETCYQENRRAQFMFGPTS
jgi:peptidoglycan-associated lipoprotein